MRELVTVGELEDLTVEELLLLGDLKAAILIGVGVPAQSISGVLGQLDVLQLLLLDLFLLHVDDLGQEVMVFECGVVEDVVHLLLDGLVALDLLFPHRVFELLVRHQFSSRSVSGNTEESGIRVELIVRL